MASYQQRFLKSRRFLMDLTEDVLAVTLCLPFTVTLHAINAIVDQLHNTPMPQQISHALWRFSQSLLMSPLVLFKGLASLVITPLSLICAIPMRSNNIPDYPFPLGRGAQSLMNAFWLQLIAIWTIGLVEIISFPTFCILFFAPDWGRTFLPAQWTARIKNLAILIFNVEVTLMALSVVMPLIQPLPAMLWALSASGVIVLSAQMMLAAAEGMWGTVSHRLAKAVQAAINFVKLKILARGVAQVRGMQLFENDQDIMASPLVELAPNTALLASNSGHLFTLDDLERNVIDRGLQNFYAPPATRVQLERGDFLRLQRHPRLGEFPQLQRFIAANPRYGRGVSISDDTLTLLGNFARRMGAPQEETNFAENFSAAQIAFNTHLAGLSVEDRNTVVNLNLYGGQDDRYALSAVLDRVYGGTFCKAGASRMILGTIARVSHPAEEAVNPHAQAVFWKRSHATHWMVGL